MSRAGTINEGSEMADETFMHLQHSEAVVAQMAATIFAGLIRKPEFTTATEDQLVERAVSIAIKLAHRAEQVVQSDEEWRPREKGSGFLAG